jgi:hypothetical protein
MLFLALRINILWFIPPNATTQLDINKIKILLKMVSWPQSSNIKQNHFHHLPSSVSIPPRKGRRIQVEPTVSVVELGILNANAS